MGGYEKLWEGMKNYGRVWEKNLLPAPGEGYAGKNNNFVWYQLPSGEFGSHQNKGNEPEPQSGCGGSFELLPVR